MNNVPSYRPPLNTPSHVVAPPLDLDASGASPSSSRKVMDEGSQGDSTRESAISGLSILDSETDEFYQQGLNHARQRDQERMRRALHGNQHAFSKARPWPLASTMGNLDRADRQGPDDTQSSSSSAPSRPDGNFNLDIPPNVPSRWGSKGKQKNDFLRRINSTKGVQGEAKGKDNDPDAIYPHKTLFTGDSPPQERRWPSVEGHDGDPGRDSPVRRRAARRASLAYYHTNGSLERIMELEKYGVESELPSISRPSQPKLDNPNPRQHGREDIQESQHESGQTIGSKQSNHARSESSVNEYLRRREPQYPTRRQFAHDPNADDDFSTDLAVLKGSEDSFQAIQNRTQTSGSKSRELLKQLARASSSTPGSSRERRKSSPLGERSRDTNQIPVEVLFPRKSTQDAGESISNYVLGSERANLKALPKSRTSGSQQRLDLLRNGSPVRNDKSTARRGHESISPFEEDQRPTKREDTATSQQSLVGRERLDKPGSTVTKRSSESLADESLRQASFKPPPPAMSEAGPSTALSRPAPQKPNHPGSALEAILKRADTQLQKRLPRSRFDPDIGENTIASLRDLMAEDPKQTQELMRLDDDTLDLVANVSVPINSSAEASENQQQDERALQRMAQSLKTVRAGLRDTSREVAGVENQVELANGANGPVAAYPRCDHCQHCAAHGRPITMWTVIWNTWTEFLGVLRWLMFYREDEQSRIKLTWFGVFVMCAAFWWALELYLEYVLILRSFILSVKLRFTLLTLVKSNSQFQPNYLPMSQWTYFYYSMTTERARYPWIVLHYVIQPIKPVFTFLWQVYDKLDDWYIGAPFTDEWEYYYRKTRRPIDFLYRARAQGRPQDAEWTWEDVNKMFARENEIRRCERGL